MASSLVLDPRNTSIVGVRPSNTLAVDILDLMNSDVLLSKQPTTGCVN